VSPGMSDRQGPASASVSNAHGREEVRVGMSAPSSSGSVESFSSRTCPTLWRSSWRGGSVRPSPLGMSDAYLRLHRRHYSPHASPRNLAAIRSARGWAVCARPIAAEERGRDSYGSGWRRRRGHGPPRCSGTENVGCRRSSSTGTWDSPSRPWTTCKTRPRCLPSAEWAMVALPWMYIFYHKHDYFL